VTGASSGIGLELAKPFAASEYDLLVTTEDDDIQERRPPAQPPASMPRRSKIRQPGTHGHGPRNIAG
jgi:NAD(P)-dependent dehydrogenase (short-subunit alcohol dehydrogenase family)